MTSQGQSNEKLAAGYAGRDVLITGAGGFIGRHLATELGKMGARTLVTVRNAKSFAPQPGEKNITVSELDVSDSSAVRGLLSGKQFDVVFHLAALAAGDRSKEQMIEQSRITLGGTINLAENLIGSQALLVHIGSSEEYGSADVPFFENQQLAPISPYSAAKAAASQFLTMAGQSFDLKAIIARPSVVFGPGQKQGMVIPYLFDCYQQKRPANISPGEQTRDFVFIDDCVEGLLILGLRPDLAGEAFNLGSGSEVKLKDVAEEIARLLEYGGDLGLGSRPYRKAEVMRHKESVVKAKDKLGWEAKTPLADGLKQTCLWWQSQLESAKNAR